MQENFFYQDRFCHDFCFLAEILDINEENVNDLPEDWQIQIELTTLEPIFEVDADILCELLANHNEERLTTNDNEEDNIKKALNSCIDFDKLKQALPHYYYPNNSFEIVTKKDLVEWFS